MTRKPRKTKPIEAAIDAQAESETVPPTPVATEATPEPTSTALVPMEPPLAPEPIVPDADLTPTTTVIPWKATIPIGPSWETTVNLGTRNDAAKMRLGRNQKFRQMTIHFEEKPTDEVRQRLQDADWTWRKAEGYWTKQLAFEQERDGHTVAERFFYELADLERQARGVEAHFAMSR